jgi:AcrR family transcriptional regulator
MADIIDAAMREFAEKGLDGARVDLIAESMRTSKRMIYYYFGGKEGLYLRVLEEAYRRARDIEARLQLDGLPPREALATLVAFTVDYQLANPEFIRLVMSENMQRGAYVARSKVIKVLNAPAIRALRSICERGVAAGVFRADIDPLDLHASISALSFFNVANRHTFALIFDPATTTPAGDARRRDNIVDMVLRYVRASPDSTEIGVPEMNHPVSP